VRCDDLPGLLASGDRGTRRAIEDAGEAVGRVLASRFHAAGRPVVDQKREECS
jgi:hypothetical protein